MRETGEFNNYSVRDFKASDFKAVQKLWEETGMGGPERGDTLQVIEKTIKCGGKLLVLVVDEELAGTSWMTQDGRRLYIHHFSVKPDYQGLGLSHMLMNTSMDWIRKQGLQVKMEVHQKNQRAIDLYKKYGFNELEGYQVYMIREL